MPPLTVRMLLLPVPVPTPMVILVLPRFHIPLVKTVRLLLPAEFPIVAVLLKSVALVSVNVLKRDEADPTTSAPVTTVLAADTCGPPSMTTELLTVVAPWPTMSWVAKSRPPLEMTKLLPAALLLPTKMVGPRKAPPPSMVMTLAPALAPLPITRSAAFVQTEPVPVTNTC
ncbi:MAG: hypothetical protein PCFJNLEI_00970 [Verrucomicrobiae bacterium]|nr:hypothetical protein [Verrucomicrobiae bacterium]